MTWTTRPPAADGLYFWRAGGEFPASFLVQVQRPWFSPVNVSGFGASHRIDAAGGQWAGPIPQPQEVELAPWEVADVLDVA